MLDCYGALLLVPLSNEYGWGFRRLSELWIHPRAASMRMMIYHKHNPGHSKQSVSAVPGYCYVVQVTSSQNEKFGRKRTLRWSILLVAHVPDDEMINKLGVSFLMLLSSVLVAS